MAFAIRFLLTLAVVVALIFLAAVAFAAELNTDVHRLLGGDSQTVKALTAAVILVGLFVTFDQTRMSLHPFLQAPAGLGVQHLSHGHRGPGTRLGER